MTEPTIPLVPADFAVPAGLATELFVLEPLDLRHNESDYAAWTSSIAHIKATPGFGGRTWLDLDLSLADNAADIGKHVTQFAERTRFAYTVLDPGSAEVIGCLYIGAPDRDGYDADVRSWTRADRAAPRPAADDAVSRWLSDDGRFAAPTTPPAKSSKSFLSNGPGNSRPPVPRVGRARLGAIRARSTGAACDQLPAGSRWKFAFTEGHRQPPPRSRPNREVMIAVLADLQQRRQAIAVERFIIVKNVARRSPQDRVSNRIRY